MNPRLEELRAAVGARGRDVGRRLAVLGGLKIGITLGCLNKAPETGAPCGVCQRALDRLDQSAMAIAGQQYLN